VCHYPDTSIRLDNSPHRSQSLAASGQIHIGSVPYNLVCSQPTVDYLNGQEWALGRSNARLYPISNRIPTWRRNPPAYPAFAEYSRSVSPSPGIDDTGVLLRAFLPYSDAALRQNLRNYTGKAIVLDSRVSCQAPQLANLVASETMI
jgi:hypothetical protein